MTRLARFVLVAVGVAALVVAAGAATRLIVLAADPGVVWPLPEWWAWVVESDHPVRAGVAAACCGAVAAVCLVLAGLVMRRPEGSVRRLDFPGDGGTTSIEAGPLDRYLARALLRHAPEVEEAKVSLYEGGERYDALAVVATRPCDLAQLHPRLLQAMSEDLRLATGSEIGRLEIEVDRFILDDKGGT